LSGRTENAGTVTTADAKTAGERRVREEPEDGLEPTTYRLQGNTPQRSDTTIWLQIGRFGDSMPTVEMRADASR
jgi:hypothetical protein